MKQTLSTNAPILDDYGYPTRPDSRRRLRKIGISLSRSIVLALFTGLMHLIGILLVLSTARQRKQQQPLTPHTFHPRRILVIRVDLIGDLVMSLTALHALHQSYPDAEIDLLGLPSSVAIVREDPEISHIFSYDPNVWRRPQALLSMKNWREGWQLYRRLRARRYDLAISLYGNVAALLAVLSRATRRVGYRRESYVGFMTDGIAGQHWQPRDHKHEVDYCLELAQAAGATVTPADRVPHLFVGPKARHEIDQMIQNAGLLAERPLVVCHVSSNNGQSKRWPVSYWATLIDRLIQERAAQVILTGAPGDLALIQQVMSRMRNQPLNFAGKTNLTQLAALMQRADLVISGDSGPMHIAEAVDAPLIAIHGPTDPALSGPVSPAVVVLRSDIWCSPCYNAKGPADCRFYTTQCMKDITPARVFESASTQLKNRARFSQGRDDHE